VARNELEELELLDEDELRLELDEDRLLEEERLEELEDERLDELEEEPLLELEEGGFDELELDADGEELDGDELEDGVVGSVGVAQPPNMPTPTSAALPDRILRNSRRSSRRLVSSSDGLESLSTISRPLLRPCSKRRAKGSTGPLLERRQRTAVVVALDGTDHVLRRDHVHAARKVTDHVHAQLLILGIAVPDREGPRLPTASLVATA